MTGMAVVVVQHRARSGQGRLGAGQHECRIEVALHDGVGAEPTAGVADRGAPIEPDHLGTRRVHALEQVIAADPEVDAGRTGMAFGEFGEDPLRVREHEPVVVGHRQRAGPRVEQLDRPGAVPQLHVDERDGMVGESLHQPVPQHLVGVHQRLGVLVGAARGAFDQVTADRERGAGERQQRHVAGQLAHQQLDGVGDVRDVVRLERPQPIEVGGAADRGVGDRPGAGLDVDPEADGVRRHHDVAVQHGRVDAVAMDRLERDLGRQRGLFDGVEDRPRSANGAVLGQAATGLTHEPHRRVSCGAGVGGLEKRNGGVGTHPGGGHYRRR